MLLAIGIGYLALNVAAVPIIMLVRRRDRKAKKELRAWEAKHPGMHPPRHLFEAYMRLRK